VDDGVGPSQDRYLDGGPHCPQYYIGKGESRQTVATYWGGADDDRGKETEKTEARGLQLVDANIGTEDRAASESQTEAT
jgi:hypothetical protein